MPLAHLNDTKRNMLDTAISDFVKKSNGSLIRCLTDFKTNEVDSVVSSDPRCSLFSAA